MMPLIVAVALTAQYPSPQGPQMTYGAPQPSLTYAVPMSYGAPQVVALGAGQVIPPGPLGQCLGRLGQKLERCAWPRVQPITAQAVGQPVAQAVYVQLVQQPVTQAVYSVPQPSYQAPPVGVPQPPAKQPPAYGTPQQAPAYGTPQGGAYQAYQAQQQQAPQPGAAKPSESVPPVPNR